MRLALPGHRHSGPLVPRIDALLAHHRRRAGEALRAVRRLPGSTAYDLAGRLTWDIRAKDWDHFPLTQKWFAVGEALSHLEYLEELGQVARREPPRGPAVYFPADRTGPEAP